MSVVKRDGNKVAFDATKIGILFDALQYIYAIQFLSKLVKKIPPFALR